MRLKQILENEKG